LSIGWQKLCPQVAKIFPLKRYFPNSDIVLEVVTDPEIPGKKQLVAFIVVE
jgi:hypothetical protein